MTDERAVLIVLSGPPGAGKTTVAGRLSQHDGRAVHVHTDDFWRDLVSGGIAPDEPEAHAQNHVVLGVIGSAAFGYAVGGFTTVVDGVIGPWMLHHFQDRSRQHRAVVLQYVVLRLPREVTLGRAQQRTAPTALVEEMPVLSMGLIRSPERARDPCPGHIAADAQTSSRLITEGIDRQRILLGP